MLAAYGSGAARVSSDESKRILNVDIGGGTTKLGLVENGRVIATAAVHIGGRLQVVEAGKIVRLDPAGKHHAGRAGFSWRAAATRSIRPACRKSPTAWPMRLSARLPLSRCRPTSDAFISPIRLLGRVDGLMFSGSVAEYIYRREQRDFGDLGPWLGQAVHARIDGGAFPWPVLPAGECIRATALGASEYSVQLSGNTSYISNPGKLLPRRNLQVLQPSFRLRGNDQSGRVAQAIRSHMTAFDVPHSEGDFALALRWTGLPSYPRLAAFAAGIKRGLAERIAGKRPLYIMLDGEVAHTLGHLLREELSIESDLLVIDGVVLWDFDYLDLGRIRMPSYTVPVTIKSLVFSEDPRGPKPQRLHHRGDNAREHPHAHDHDHQHRKEQRGHDHAESRGGR